MNILREIYDFITGGSISAPIGLAVAIVAAIVLGHGAAASYVFFALILMTLLAATNERVT